MNRNDLMISPANTGVKLSVSSDGLGAEALLAVSERRMAMQHKHEHSIAKLNVYRDLMKPNVDAICEIAQKNNDPTILMQYAAHLANELLHD